MPAITSSDPAVEIWVTTGATATTCGNLARMPPTLMDIGAPVSPTMYEDPGGMTITSAPIPACLCLVSFRMPSDNPTISRIRVTSRATATILIRERIGRCTRLPTIIRFIILIEVLELLPVTARSLSGIGLSKPHHFRSRRLFQCKLIVLKRFVQFKLYEAEGNVVILLRPFDLDG